MRIEDELILELCRKNKRISIIDGILRKNNLNFKYVLDVSAKNLIKPFILECLIKHPLPEKNKENLITAARSAVVESTLLNQMIKREFFRVKSFFKDAAIDLILMKGLTLNFSGIRTIGDLDILIHEKDLLAADQLARKAGFEYVGSILNRLIKKKEKNDLVSQLSWNNQFQYYNRQKGLLLELHTNLFERSRAYNLDLDLLLDGINLFWENKIWNDDLESFTFCNEHQLLLMCLHTALKRSLYNKMFVLRNLLDIQAIIEQSVNWGTFQSTAFQLKITPFVSFALMFSNRLIGTDAPGHVLDLLNSQCSPIQRMMNDIHVRSFHSLESSSLFYSNLYKILLPFIYHKKFLPRIKNILLIPYLFPPWRTMAAFYHLRNNNPIILLTYFLNPLRWIYLLLVRIFNLIRK